MKKFLAFTAAVLLLMTFPSARAAEAPGEVHVFKDEQMTGVILGALTLTDGLLILGSSAYEDDGWMAYVNRDGSTRWLLEEEGFGVFSCPAALDGGGFSALINRHVKYDYSGNPTGKDESLLAIVSADGEITRVVQLPYETEWLVHHEDGYFAIGTSYAAVSGGYEGWKAALTRLDSAGGKLWSLAYSNPSFSGMTFSKGVVAGNSLILIGEAYPMAPAPSVGLIHRLDLSGQVLWSREATLGNDTSISDICVSPHGLIAGCYASLQYDGVDSFPAGRMGSVFCLDMEGRQLWEYALKDELMADYILPISGGFLCGSRGLNLEECPLQGDGWLLMIDEAGNTMAPDSTPVISGGKFELMGMAIDTAGKPLLYGVLLDEPGFPGAPFLSRLNFPVGE